MPFQSRVVIFVVVGYEFATLSKADAVRWSRPNALENGASEKADCTARLHARLEFREGRPGVTRVGRSTTRNANWVPVATPLSNQRRSKISQVFSEQDAADITAQPGPMRGEMTVEF